MSAPLWTRHSLYAAMGVALAVSMLAIAAAAVLSSASTQQSASYFGGGDGGAPGYGAPTLQVTTTPAGTVACSGATVTDSTLGSTATVIVSATKGSAACTAGDYAEEFTLGFAGIITTQSNSIEVSTQVGSNDVQVSSVTLTLGTGLIGPFTATVNVYVDYGSVGAPSGGITVLDLVAR